MSEQGGDDLDSPVAIPEHIWRKEARHVLTQIKNHACAEPFLEPVDPVEHECPDYFNKVKHPMDLGTVTEKLDSYSSPLAFANDVRLTFENAKTYNPADHEVYEYAEAMSSVFENFWSMTVAGANTSTESKRRGRATIARFAPGHDKKNPSSNGSTGGGDRKNSFDRTKSGEEAVQDNSPQNKSAPKRELARGKGGGGNKAKPPPLAESGQSSQAGKGGAGRGRGKAEPAPRRPSSASATSSSPSRRPFASAASAVAALTSAIDAPDQPSPRSDAGGARRGRPRKSSEGEAGKARGRGEEEAASKGGESEAKARKKAEGEGEQKPEKRKEAEGGAKRRSVASSDGGGEQQGEKRGRGRPRKRPHSPQQSAPASKEEGAARRGRKQGEEEQEKEGAGEEKAQEREGGAGRSRRRGGSCSPLATASQRPLPAAAVAAKVLSPKSPSGRVVRVGDDALEEVKLSCREMLEATSRALAEAVTALADVCGAPEAAAVGADDFADDFAEDFMDDLDDEETSFFVCVDEKWRAEQGFRLFEHRPQSTEDIGHGKQRVLAKEWTALTLPRVTLKCFVPGPDDTFAPVDLKTIACLPVDVTHKETVHKSRHVSYCQVAEQAEQVSLAYDILKSAQQQQPHKGKGEEEECDEGALSLEELRAKVEASEFVHAEQLAEELEKLLGSKRAMQAEIEELRSAQGGKHAAGAEGREEQVVAAARAAFEAARYKTKYGKGSSLLPEGVTDEQAVGLVWQHMATAAQRHRSGLNPTTPREKDLVQAAEAEGRKSLQERLQDIFCVVDWLLDHLGLEVSPIPSLSKRGSKPFEAWARKLDNLCVPNRGIPPAIAHDRLRTIQRQAAARAREDADWQAWSSYGIGQNVVKQPQISLVLRPAASKTAAPRGDGRARSGELKLSWKKVDEGEEELQPWSQIAGFYMRYKEEEAGAEQAEAMSGYILVQKAAADAFVVSHQSGGPRGSELDARQDLWSLHSTDPLRMPLYHPRNAERPCVEPQSFYEISVLCNTRRPKKEGEEGVKEQGRRFPGTLLTLLMFAKFVEETTEQGTHPERSAGVLLTPASWIAKDDIVVDKELSSSDFAEMRAPKKGKSRSIEQEIKAQRRSKADRKALQKKHSRHASTYNSRLVQHYWETLGMHPAFPENLTDPMVYISFMAPIEAFDHTKAMDVLGTGKGAPTPDVQAYRLTQCDDLRLLKEEVRMYVQDAPRQRRARFSMFGLAGTSPYRVREADARRPKGCMYRNLPTPQQLVRMLVRLFVKQSSPGRVKTLIEKAAGIAPSAAEDTAHDKKIKEEDKVAVKQEEAEETVKRERAREPETVEVKMEEKMKAEEPAEEVETKEQEDERSGAEADVKKEEREEEQEDEAVRPRKRLRRVSEKDEDEEDEEDEDEDEENQKFGLGRGKGNKVKTVRGRKREGSEEESEEDERGRKQQQRGGAREQRGKGAAAERQRRRRSILPSLLESDSGGEEGESEGWGDESEEEMHAAGSSEEEWAAEEESSEYEEDEDEDEEDDSDDSLASSASSSHAARRPAPTAKRAVTRDNKKSWRIYQGEGSSSDEAEEQGKVGEGKRRRVCRTADSASEGDSSS